VSSLKKFVLARSATVVVAGLAIAGAGVYPADAGVQGTVNPSSIIHTFAGTGVAGYNGDGLLAVGETLYQPRDSAMGPDGSVYIVDTYNNRVRKVDTQGVMTTVAGNGVGGYGGDNGPATSASVKWPHDVTVDSTGIVYFADSNNNRVRRVDLNGIITTIAGTGSGGFSGDGGLATVAKLRNPKSVALFGGNLYIADSKNNRIREVDLGTGIITTVAGTGVAGFSGDGGPALSAQMNTPQRIAFDSVGNLYFTDTYNNRIRRVDAASHLITTIAGNGVQAFGGDGGPAVNASLNRPRGIALGDDDRVYIGDSGNQRVRQVIVSTGVISTLAGSGKTSYSGDGGPASAAGLYNPRGLTVDPAGDLLIADTFHNVIRIITATPATT